jgi:hypothetical protein
MYFEAAQAPANFLHGHLYNVENVVQDTISARMNNSCGRGQGIVEVSYNSGAMIEEFAMNILYSITRCSTAFGRLPPWIASNVEVFNC